MHEIGCSGLVCWDEMERKVGGRFRMGDTCTPVADAVNVWENQYNKVISLQLK